MTSLNHLKKELLAEGNKERAAQSMRFFKTGKGQYGAGDVFIGISVPKQRKIAQKYQNLPLEGIQKLLHAKEHEYRLTGLFILVLQYQKGDSLTQKKLADFYLLHARRVNNWDLVDSSAANILGHFLSTYHTKKQTLKLLHTLAQSDNLWERRIAIVSSWAFIRQGDAEVTFALVKSLLSDREDLMHKASGWMLREVGKYCGRATLSYFLDEYAHQLPRTALRYALEHYPDKRRKSYLAQKSLA